MRLTVAGGCHEHGRNCFLIETDNFHLLLDCGVMDKNIYPSLSTTQIQSLDYCFISHSHADHCGAFSWLVSQGFKGTLIMSQATFEQWKPDYSPCVLLRDENEVELEHFKLLWGASGHCEGSIWGYFQFEQQVFFSGDMSLTSQYQCAFPNHLSADLAILDCAYGNHKIDEKKALQEIKAWINNHSKPVLLPVPKQGRGHIFYEVFKEQWKTVLLDQLQTTNNLAEVILLKDAQLREIKNVQDLKKYPILLTGHAEADSVAKNLLESKEADFISYPIHLCLDDCQQIKEANHFENIVLNHCQESIQCDFKEYRNLKVKDQLVLKRH